MLQRDKQAYIPLAKGGRHPYSGGILYSLMGQRSILDLETRQHLAANVDSLGHATAEIKQTDLVEAADVARVEPQVPARLECLFRYPEIAVSHDPGLARADHHLAILSRRQQIVIFIDNRHFVMRQHDPARRVRLRHHHPARIGQAIATTGMRWRPNRLSKSAFGTSAGLDQHRVTL